jgi:hypothetical protein
MSVETPVVAVVFGFVTPPQGDILELRVHLGCSREVSSFECLLQNFDKKYTVTNPINVGDNGSISIGRGTNCPLIITLRVEEVQPESTPVENYIRVRGRCWGEKLFRRVVTKTYENQKGEAIVKDVLDNYVGLSHVRDSTELVENTDTTYTLLEYENTPVFDILKYIAENADKAGVIGFDFRVEWDGKFAFFPKNSKTSPISLSERIEVSRYSKDIHRIRNKITVYGAAEKANPSDKDAWTETLDINDDTTDDWSSGTGTGSVSLDSADKIVGSYSIRHTTSTPDYYGCAVLTLPSGMEVDCNKYPSLTFQIKLESAFNGNIGLELEDSAGMKVRREIGVSPNNKWNLQGFNVGKKHSDEWTHSIFNSQPFNWSDVKKILWYCNFSGTGTGAFWIDNLFFNRRRWEATQENSSSQSSYGLRELVEIDEELHSDNECDLRAKALLDHLSDPAEFLTLRTTCLDYGTNRLLPGDKIHVTLPNENIDSDFRIISVEYRVIAREQTLEITLELGKEKPLLADYLYGLRATTVTVEKLMRTKAGRTGVAGSAGGGGGGGGGGGTDEKVKVTSNDTVAEYLKDKLAAGTGITLTEQNDGGDENLRIATHREWNLFDEPSWIRTLCLPLGTWSKVGVTLVGLGGWHPNWVSHPRVLYFFDLDEYWVYFAGGNTNRSIGLAKGSSLKSALTEITNGIGNTSRVLDASGTPGAFDETGVSFPSVFYDLLETDNNKKFKMLFNGRNGAGAYDSIGYAYSADGKSWTKYAGNPVIDRAHVCTGPALLRLGNIYYALYRKVDTNNILLEYSEDLVNWTEWGNILSLGAAGEWDDNRIQYPTLYFDQGTFYLNYAGKRAGVNDSMGIAISNKFFETWQKLPYNPILTDAASAVVSGCMIRMEEEFLMVYEHSTPKSIRSATIP